MNENPYIYNRPLDPEADKLVCIPREETTQAVVETIINGLNVFIMGHAKYGKTTFLKQVALALKNNAYTIFLDINEAPVELKNFYDWMKNQFTTQISRYYNIKLKDQDGSHASNELTPEMAFADFLKSFPSHFESENMSSNNSDQSDNNRIVLLVDNIENSPLIDNFLSFWNEICQGKSINPEYQKYSIAMVGFSRLQEKAIAPASQFNKANFLYLNRFSESVSRQLIEIPLKKSSILISENAINNLIEKIEGHPQMLQQCCHFLFERVNRNSRKLTEKDSNDGLDNLIQNSDILRMISENFRTNKKFRDAIEKILNNAGASDIQDIYFAILPYRDPIYTYSDFIIWNKMYGKVISDILIKEKKEIIADGYLEKLNKKPMPYAISGIKIKNYNGIFNIHMNLPVDAQWIFLTGENAFGKTSILRAITIGLQGMRDSDTVIFNTGLKKFISVEIFHNDELIINNINRKDFDSFRYFAVYGSSRLQIQSDRTSGEIIGRSSKTYGIFNTDAVLLNINRELLLWNLSENPRYEVVKKYLLKLLPHAADIIVDREKMEVLYTEKENPGNDDLTFEPIPFEKLAAGNKSIIAMIGDLLIRFYKAYDDAGNKGIHPKDFEGIVIIDELDLHLHPKWLKKLPTLLSDLFPKIQFIASTHSVIPILGAPKKSVLLKVTRTQKEGIKVDKLDVDFKNLLPHQLLTSPIFDLEDIVPVANERFEEIRTENNYKDILSIDNMMDDLKKFEESDKDFPET